MDNINQQYNYGFVTASLASRNGRRRAIMKQNIIQHAVYGNGGKRFFSMNANKQIYIDDDNGNELMHVDYDPSYYNPTNLNNTSLRKLNRMIMLQEYLDTPSPYQSNIDTASQHSMSISNESSSDNDMDENSRLSSDNMDEELIHSPRRINSQSKRRTGKNRQRRRRRRQRRKLTKRMSNVLAKKTDNTETWNDEMETEKSIAGIIRQSKKNVRPKTMKRRNNRRKINQQNIEPNSDSNDNQQELSLEKSMDTNMYSNMPLSATSNSPERKLTSLERIINEMFQHSFRISELEQKKSKQECAKPQKSMDPTKSQMTIELNEKTPGDNNSVYILYPPPTND